MSKKIRNLDLYMKIKEFLQQNNLIVNKHLINISYISRKFNLNYLTTRKYIKDILENEIREIK